MLAHPMTIRKEAEMRRRSVKIILGTLAVSALLGVGVAAAASQPSSAGANAPQATNVASGARTGDQIRIRARDGTGPRHDQMQSQTHQRLRDGTGPWHGQQPAQNANRAADCPYRS
jgi:hypothetical protein